ncbi:MAG: hypothetical protein HYS61_08065 [Acidobacteria bacterium]|nr:hypothetical protein [Acidobacteriota bacterium]
MPTRSIIAGTVSATGTSSRRAIALAAAVLLAVIGLSLGTLKVLDDGSKSSAPALNDGERFVFVPSRGAPEVTAIDSKTDRVVARIGVAGIPNRVLVSDAVGAIVASFAGRSTLQLVDLSSRTPPGGVDLTITPDFMVLSPDGYVVAAADSSRGSVAVVSLQNRRLLFRLGGFGDPRNLTFSSDGSQLYITDRKALELVVVDIVQQTVVERVALAPDVNPGANRMLDKEDGAGVSALTRSPDGRYGFVSLADLDSLLAVDLSTFKPVKRLRVGRAPLRPFGTADGRFMLVPNEGDQSVSVINTTALEVTATLPGAKDVTAINTGWFESAAFVISHSQKRVVVLDLMKLRRLDDIGLPGSPGAGVVTSNGQKLYVSLEDTDQVAIIDTRTRKLLAVIDRVGRQPWGVTMARSNNYCHS